MTEIITLLNSLLGPMPAGLEFLLPVFGFILVVLGIVLVSILMAILISGIRG